MKKTKNQVRTKWLHIRLNESEYDTIRRHWQQTTSGQCSDYARRVLLRKPVIINYRNQSADEILAEMIRMKNALTAIGNNFNQAAHHLHTLGTKEQVQTWILMHENLKTTLLGKIEVIRLRMNQIHEQWSRK